MMVPQEIWARILVDDNSKLGMCFFLHWNRHGLSGRGSTHMQRLVCKGVCVGGGHLRAFSQWYGIACLHAHAR